MKIFLIIFLSIMIIPIFAPSHPEYVGVDSPRKQIAQGILPEEVICKEGLVLMIKYNDSPACVKPSTAKILEERGWGGMPPPCCKPTEVFSITNFEECIAAGNPAMESYPRQCRTPDGLHFVEEINDNPEPLPEDYCYGNAACYFGIVTKIVDGDTIEVNGQSIRFALVNTPEYGDYGYTEARNFIETVCPVGSPVLVDQDDGQTQGSYNRMIAVIYCNYTSFNLNEAILDAGLAEIDTRFCRDSEFGVLYWALIYGCSFEEPEQAAEPVEEQPNCDPSYPDVCIAVYPPDLNCGDIPYKNFVVVGSDPHGFDGDGDGIGCES